MIEKYSDKHAIVKLILNCVFREVGVNLRHEIYRLLSTKHGAKISFLAPNIVIFRFSFIKEFARLGIIVRRNLDGR